MTDDWALIAIKSYKIIKKIQKVVVLVLFIFVGLGFLNNYWYVSQFDDTTKQTLLGCMFIYNAILRY